MYSICLNNGKRRIYFGLGSAHTHSEKGRFTKRQGRLPERSLFDVSIHVPTFHQSFITKYLQKNLRFLIVATDALAKLGASWSTNAWWLSLSSCHNRLHNFTTFSLILLDTFWQFIGTHVSTQCVQLVYSVEKWCPKCVQNCIHFNLYQSIQIVLSMVFNFYFCGHKIYGDILTKKSYKYPAYRSGQLQQMIMICILWF